MRCGPRFANIAAIDPAYGFDSQLHQDRAKHQSGRLDEGPVARVVSACSSSPRNQMSFVHDAGKLDPAQPEPLRTASVRFSSRCLAYARTFGTYLEQITQ